MAGVLPWEWTSSNQKHIFLSFLPIPGVPLRYRHERLQGRCQGRDICLPSASCGRHKRRGQPSDNYKTRTHSSPGQHVQYRRRHRVSEKTPTGPGRIVGHITYVTWSLTLYVTPAARQSSSLSVVLSPKADHYHCYSLTSSGARLSTSSTRDKPRWFAHYLWKAVFHDSLLVTSTTPLEQPQPPTTFCA